MGAASLNCDKAVRRLLKREAFLADDVFFFFSFLFFYSTLHKYPLLQISETVFHTVTELNPGRNSGVALGRLERERGQSKYLTGGM